MTCSTQRPHQSYSDLDYMHQDAQQWREDNSHIDYAAPEDSIVIFGGLTPLQDHLLLAAIRSMGGTYDVLPNPDNESFRLGKIYGNRGQCNPTYFTSGNLIKYLQNLHEQGMSKEEIVRKYVFATASSCGPCRFGMYATDYRKALETAGFGGLRIETFEQQKGIGQIEGDTISPFSPKFFVLAAKSVAIGDIINLMGYRMRPYEVVPGSVDQAMERSQGILEDAIKHKKNLTIAMLKCRKFFQDIELDMSRAKPKVMVMGEFWAAMTEGDGNYHIHRFLESEGAEVIPQLLMNRFLLSIWEAKYALNKKADLPDQDRPFLDFEDMKRRFLIKGTDVVVKSFFTIYAKAIGLKGYKLPDMDKLYKLSKDYYPVDADGGEGHLEVAHVIEAVEEDLAHLVISLKPFGCMPSSAVSDGIQSLVTAHYPSANFLSIETSGEGAANFYSRVQMALYKAKEAVKVDSR